jgi:signal peptidase I
MDIAHLDPPAEPPPRRRAWVALLLSLATSGLGHLYAGAPRRAVFFFALLQATTLLAICLAAAGLLLPPWPARWSLAPLAMLCAVIVLFLLLMLVDAVRTARGASFAPRWYNRWYVCAGVAVLGMMVGSAESALFRRNFVQAFWLPSGSMQPTLLIGDSFFVDKRAYHEGAPPRRGDVVIFRSPIDSTVQFAKRAVAVAGDSVEIRAKRLLVNGVAIDEPYVQFIDPTPGKPPRDDYGPETVPQGKVFVLGDNRDRSYDSRHFGLVRESDLLGRAAVIYWSFDGAMPRWRRIGMQIE